MHSDKTTAKRKLHMAYVCLLRNCRQYLYMIHIFFVELVFFLFFFLEGCVYVKLNLFETVNIFLKYLWLNTGSKVVWQKETIYLSIDKL